MEGTGDVPEVGTPQRTCRGDRQESAAAADHRAAPACVGLAGAVGGGGHLRLWLDVDPPAQRLRAVHRFGGAGAERDRADPDDAAQAGIVVGVAAGEHRGGAAVLQPWPALDLDPVCRLLDQRAGGAAPLAQPDALAQGQQRGVAARGGGVHRHRLLGGEAQQVVRAAGLRAGAGQALPAERLHADHRTDLVAVDVDVADVDTVADAINGFVDARMHAQGQAVAGGVDLVDHRVELVALPADHVQHRPEDFFLVDAHVGGDTGKDGRADEVALLEAIHLRLAAIEHQLGALLHARGDQAFHALAGAAGNDRADIGAGHGAAADLQGLGLGHQVLHPAAGLTDQQQGGGGHATLAGGTEGGADHRIEARRGCTRGYRRGWNRRTTRP
ncbi:hypothetical protein G6F68_010400 [Rhizopus microsporus]|nr:hypothetical protein G6F68_010400 [Rhizopus microsporus]